MISSKNIYTKMRYSSNVLTALFINNFAGRFTPIIGNKCQQVKTAGPGIVYGFPALLGISPS